MSDKVFWGIVGGILVAELACFFFLVWPKMGEYDKESNRLANRVKAMESLAKKDVQELPTEKRLEAYQRHNEQVKSNRDATQAVWDGRDAAYEGPVESNGGGASFDPATGTLGAWQAHYANDYQKLSDRYKEKIGFGEDGDNPIPMVKNTNDKDMVLAYEKEWRAQKAIVSTLIDFGGSITNMRTEIPRDVRIVLPHHERTRQSLHGSIPPKNLTPFIEKLLADPMINFDMHLLVVSKNDSELKYTTVEEIQLEEGQEEPPPAEEPNVRFVVKLDILDWTGIPEPKSEDDEEDDEDD